MDIAGKIGLLLGLTGIVIILVAYRRRKKQGTDSRQQHEAP